MPTFTQHRPGVGSVGQYQMSGKPYATASLEIADGVATEITFPYVTKFVTVVNSHQGSSAPLLLGFSALGITNTNNYISLDNGESYTGEWRVRSVFLAGDGAPTTGSVYAGLTGVEAPLDYSGSAGVG